MTLLITPMLLPLSRWAERSQRGACRNAMIAATALRARRRERDEVQEYVDTLLAHRETRVPVVDHTLPATADLG